MKITTFFINKFKEVSLPTPVGNQEVGGVYGDELSYSQWNLNDRDFTGIVKTNILFGELYKITLDTGIMFDPQIPGGTPDINGFMNMDLNTYWTNIINNRFTFNDQTYEQYKNSKSLTFRGGAGQQGGGPGVPGGPSGPLGGGPQGGQGGPSFDPAEFPTLTEYANGVKERIGWVEVNRSRASIYYELCSGGKRARSDHFYDINTFIMTAELFDTDNINNTEFYSYENVNPYTGEAERYYTVNRYNAPVTTNISETSRLTLTPIDSWFTWTNTPQGHFKSSIYTPGNIGGYLDIFPWPRGPMWGQYRGTPKDYLTALVTGNSTAIEASMDPISISGTNIQEIKLPKPPGIGDVKFQVPLLFAEKERHLNTLMSQTLTMIDQAGRIQPISSVYSTNIWGEKREPDTLNTLQLAISSNISRGECQEVSGLESETEDIKRIFINDPFGFDSLELDKEYLNVYTKFKFCEPYKKFKTSSLDDSIQLPNNTLTTSVGTKTSVGNIEEYTLPNNLKIIKVGAFNPDESLDFIDLPNDYITVDDKLNFSPYYNTLDITEYNGIVPRTTEGDGTIGIQINDSYTIVDAVSKKIHPIAEKNSFVRNLHQYHYDKESSGYFEMTHGLREPDEFITTNVEIPYGTYKYKIETSVDSKNQLQKTIKIKRNGADADPTEFKKSVTELNKISGNNRLFPKAIGVSSTGLPIFEKNTLEQSLLKLKEELTGVKEIIFRGSDAIFGVVSSPGFYNPAAKNISDALPPINVPTQYINTGISVSGQVDVTKGEKIDLKNLYTFRVPTIGIDNLNINDINRKKESNWLEPGDVDIIATKYDDYFGQAIPNMQSVTHILLSKFDGFNVLKETWPAGENKLNISIKDTTTGTIFLDDRFLYGKMKSAMESVNTDTFIFNIVGKVEELGSGTTAYYKIPVKFVKSNYNGTPPGFGQEFNLVKKHELCITECEADLKIQVDRINSRYDRRLRLEFKALRDQGISQYDLLGMEVPIYQEVRKRVEEQKQRELDMLLPLRKETEICVEKCNEEYNRNVAGQRNYIPMFLAYSKDITTQNPMSGPQYIQSSQNTYGGWQFSGLWHRAGYWPSEHKFRSGLLGSPNWGSCDGGVNTGAWIKVDRQRVRLEFHSFGKNGRDAVYNYIHKLWLTKKNIALDDQLYNPPAIRHEPSELKSSSWESWERDLHNLRQTMIKDLQNIKEQVLILRLRDNQPDSNRGLKSLDYLYSPDRFGIKYSSANSQYPWIWEPGLFQEEHIIYRGNSSDDDSKLDDYNMYTYQLAPEPKYHESGLFDPNEWYKAIFIRAVSGPSNPNGQLSGRLKNNDPRFSGKSCRESYLDIPVGKFKPNNKNKKTFCETLYVSEQILRMHRQRLKTLKEYVDRRTSFFQKTVSISEMNTNKFNNHMKFVRAMRMVFNHVAGQ